MAEQKAEYVTRQELNDAEEMLGAGYEHRITNESNDHKYFIITPRIIHAYARNPHDLALWHTVKDVAGESGECYLSTSDLATLCDMSSGQVSKSRAYWLKTGFLKGSLRRDPGYPQPVWHLSVPDVWGRNVKWCEEHPRIADRLAHKKSLHLVKPSPSEEGITYSEEGITPGETKKTYKKNEKGEGEAPAPDFKNMSVAEARRHPTIRMYTEAAEFFPPSVAWELVDQFITAHKLTAEQIHGAAAAWAMAGYKQGNVKGILEWAANGIPEKNRSARAEPDMPHPERKVFEKEAQPKFVPPPPGLMDRFKKVVKAKEVSDGV